MIQDIKCLLSYSQDKRNKTRKLMSGCLIDCVGKNNLSTISQCILEEMNDVHGINETDSFEEFYDLPQVYRRLYDEKNVRKDD